MPLQPTPYRPAPYVSQVYQPDVRFADLLRAQGQDAAAAQDRRGAIAAQLWSGIANTISNAGAAVQKNIQDAPIRQLEQLRVKNALADDASRQNLEGLQAQGTLPPGSQGPTQPNPFLVQEGDTHVWDVGKLSAAAASNGKPLSAESLASIANTNKAIRDEQSGRQSAQEKQTALVKASAQLGIHAIDTGMDPSQVVELVGAQLRTNPAIKPDLLEAQLADLKSDPMKIRAKLDALAGPAALKELAPGASLVDERSLKPVYTNPKEAPQPTEAGLESAWQALEQKRLTGGTLTPSERAAYDAYKNRRAITTPTSNEWKDVLLDGKAAKVFVDPKTKVVTDLAGTVITSPETRIKPVPPASVQVQNLVSGGASQPASPGEKAMANYMIAPPSARSISTPAGKAMMDRILTENPSYDASLYANRAPTRKAFTTGVQGRQINNINTAIGHIDQLTDVADQLTNGSFVPGNRAWNTLRQAFGSDATTNFDTLKDALSGEVAGVLSQSGATVSGIKDAQSKISTASSPQQLAGYVKTLIPIMGAKLSSLDYQYHQAMGDKDPFSALSPDSKAILEKHGVSGTHGSAATERVVGPTGQRGTVPRGTPLPEGWRKE